MSDEYRETEWLYLGVQTEPPEYETEGDAQSREESDESPF